MPPSETAAILDKVKPEVVYFTEMNGQRIVILTVEQEQPSMLPGLAEPCFLTNADVAFDMVMSFQDLQEADFERTGQK